MIGDGAEMQLELHQLELRYERLRERNAGREKRLLASLAQDGQQTPIVVVVDAAAPSADAVVARYVVIDGYKRVRLLRRLGQDTLVATCWELSEPDALVLEGLMRGREQTGPIEQGWLLRELRQRFGLGLQDLARRFDHDISWVSRRLALVERLPERIEQHVRSGAIAAHAAMKFLVPLARANCADTERLADALAPLGLSTRQIGALALAWDHGSAQTRQMLLSNPLLVLRAREQPNRQPTPAEQLLGDVELLSAVARRIHGRLRRGATRSLLPPERDEIGRRLGQARTDVETLTAHYEKELRDARPEHPSCDPAAA
jgi:ParB-like chromosome segregation protein Spo0J